MFLKIKKHFSFPLIIFLICLLPSTIIAGTTIPAVYKWLKYLEFSFLALWIKQNIDLNAHFQSIINWLTASLLFQSLLGLCQWFQQSSIFAYWFLGEQPYHPATPGIDKIIWFDGSLKMPPMATFPHPNLLGGFLAVILPLVLYRIIRLFQSSQPRYYQKTLFSISFLLGITNLFLTFSLSAWLAFLLIGLPMVILLIQIRKTVSPQRYQQLSLVKNLPRFNFWRTTITKAKIDSSSDQQNQTKTLMVVIAKMILVYTGVFLIILSLSKKLSFLAPESSFSRRSQLSQIASDMIKYRPVAGVGLNNFTIIMEKYGYVTATTRFLQPIHNIYQLILAESGLIGLAAFIYLILFPIYKTLTIKPQSNNRLLMLTSYCSLLFIGLFDHYPLTIQQGSLLFYILLGVSIPNKYKPFLITRATALVKNNRKSLI